MVRMRRISVIFAVDGLGVLREVGMRAQAVVDGSIADNSIANGAIVKDIEGRLERRREDFGIAPCTAMDVTNKTL